MDQRSFPFANFVVVVISEVGPEGTLPEGAGEIEAIGEVASVVEDEVTLEVTFAVTFAVIFAVIFAEVEVGEVVEEVLPESKAPESLRMAPT